MLTHLIKSINWIDIALLCLFLRVIFIAVTNGFITEFFKCVGVVLAVFVSLHYYSFLAAWFAHATNFPSVYWEVMVFAVLWFAVVLIFKFIREGILLLFKIETNHQGFDKYAAGILAIGRGVLICSLTIFLIFLVNNAPVTRMTLRSYGYKISGRAAAGTYSFLFNNLVDKLWAGQHYNAAVGHVLHPDGK